MTGVMTGSRPWTRFYEPSVPPSLPYPDLTLGSLLEATARKFSDHTALLFYGKKISYAELDALANRFAHGLATLGVRKGDRVAIMLPNVPQMVIAYYGTLRTGAIAVPTNPLYHEHELEVQLRDSGAETIVALDLFYPVISHVLPRTSVKHIVLANVKDYLPFPKNLLYPLKARLEKQWVPVKREPPVHDFPGLLRHQPVTPVDSTLSPGDTALLQYTGGTTGVPKGAVLTHRNLVVNAVQSRAWLTLRNEGEAVVLAAIPFFHVYGMTTAMNLGILIGAKLILLPKFHTKEVIDVIEKERPQIFPGIQAMYLAIANYPGIQQHDLSSLKVAISGAGPLMREVQDRFEHLTVKKSRRGSRSSGCP
jgi:long-chain acyl-CoA synthetase